MQDGKLEYIDGVTSFPDFPPSAKIKGKANPLIPQKVTTWKQIKTIRFFHFDKSITNHRNDANGALGDLILFMKRTYRVQNKSIAEIAATH